MEFQPYQIKHKTRIVEIFRSNCPKYFDVADEKYLVDFLDNYADNNYLVVLKNRKIIGCGGHYTKDNFHGIAWVMFERNSIGVKELLKVADSFYLEIEQRIIAENKHFDVRINTTQLMEKMFNRYGFRTFEIIKDGFGQGLDEYKMKKQFGDA
ncbi:MAG: N-acetyltransferase [Bacteroidota bacterium]